MKCKSFAQTVLALAAASAFLIFPAQAAQGAKNGLGYALNILIPSLYPFLVLSVFLARSGAFERLGRVLERPSRFLFRLPGSAASAALMSVLGGYPVGARSAAALAEEGTITREQAERMMCFCVNAGPSFVVTAVGVGFCRSAKNGWILFFSQIVTFLLLGVLSGLFARHECVTAPAAHSRPASASPGVFLRSAADAGRSMLMMCGMVILFAAGINLLRPAVADPDLRAILSAVFEVTGGCADLARRGAPLWTIAAALGWGGVCVHFQVFACLSGLAVSRRRFVFWRTAQAALSGCVCFVLCRLFPDNVEVFSNFSGSAYGTLSGSVPAAVLLAMLCAVLLFSLPRKKMEIRDE